MKNHLFEISRAVEDSIATKRLILNDNGLVGRVDEAINLCVDSLMCTTFLHFLCRILGSRRVSSPKRFVRHLVVDYNLQGKAMGRMIEPKRITPVKEHSTPSQAVFNFFPLSPLRS